MRFVNFQRRELVRISRLTTFAAFACLAMTGISTAADLTPGSGHSVRIGAMQGILYYTADQEGYKVITTLAAGADGLPIRFSTTLAAGQRAVISVPQSVGEPPVDFEIVRNGDVLVVNEPATSAPQLTHRSVAFRE